jgi:hypothetical protein
MHYDLKTIHQRFIQISGKLVSLGYSSLVLPQIHNFEYDAYLRICPPEIRPRVTALYQQLVKKKVEDKWRIVLSYLQKYRDIYFEYDIPTCQEYEWQVYYNKQKIQIYLDNCSKLNKLTAEERSLIDSWIGYLKYSMR